MRYKPEKIVNEVDYKKLPKKELYQIFLEDMENIDIEDFDECYVTGEDNNTFEIDGIAISNFRTAIVYHEEWYIIYYIVYAEAKNGEHIFKAYTNITDTNSNLFLKVFIKDGKIKVPKGQNHIDTARLTAVIRKLIPIFEKNI